MRASRLTMLTLAGCVGGANLGSERVVPELDGGPALGSDDMVASDLDATLPDGGGLPDDAGLAVSVRVDAPTDSCGLCFDLTAQTARPAAAYTFEWDDGSRDALRRVCPSAGQLGSYTVRVREPSSAREGMASTQLSPRPNTCPPDAGAPELLCLANRSFDRTPLVPPLPGSFGAVPWVACGTLGGNNPQLIDGAAALPPLAPSDSDSSFLSLAQDDQASQQPCLPLPAGKSRSFKIDLAALTTDVVSDTYAPTLQIWAGASLDCSRSELLWTSPTLTSSWTTSCVTITPRDAFDNFTLRATSNGTLPYPGRVYVDKIEPVASCP